MRLLQPTFKIREQEPGVQGIYKAIEYPGRICYGSIDKIAEGSAEKFVKMLESSNHGAPMEHGAVYLQIREDDQDYYDLVNFYSINEYSKIEIMNLADYDAGSIDYAFISTNYRVLFENDRMSDLKFLCELTQYHHRRVTVEFTCNIGVTREYNRHRKDSINEESTRYCNYSKDKFGNEIGIIENNNKFGDRLDALEEDNLKNDIVSFCKRIVAGDKFSDIDYWLFANKASEFSYVGLTRDWDWKAQDARDILPIDLKSTLVHSAFIEDWEHFFDLRAKGTTGAPHPQAKELAYPLMEEFIKLGYIKNDK